MSMEYLFVPKSNFPVSVSTGNYSSRYIREKGVALPSKLIKA